MAETEPPLTALGDAQLEAWRLALAALEGERARLIAKYDQRISELKKSIKELERSLARQPRPDQGKPPARSRRSR